MSSGTAKPRGVLARLRHQAGPLLPAFLRRAGGRALHALEARRGSTYEIAGHRIRFLAGSAPTVVAAVSDERANVDAVQLAHFAKAIQPGDVVADVGAYRGTYTLVAAACAGSRGRVTAFEPTRVNAEAILANARLNGFTDRVTVEEVAVSEREGAARFFAWGDATTNSLVPQQSQAQSLDVRTISLDAYFGKALPDVVKIDIEGAELLALRGAQRILASEAVIICELHPYAWSEFGHTGDDLRMLLRRYNRYAADLTTGVELGEYRYGAVLLARRD